MTVRWWLTNDRIVHKLHCMICGQVFPSAKKLQRHRKKIHKS